MPSINLRLTDEQHSDLERWAKDGHRSLQKEIIWRLFAAEGHYAPKIGAATSEPRVAVEVPPDGTEVELRNVTAEVKRKRFAPCRHFLPPTKHCPYGCDA